MIGSLATEHSWGSSPHYQRAELSFWRLALTWAHGGVEPGSISSGLLGKHRWLACTRASWASHLIHQVLNHLFQTWHNSFLTLTISVCWQQHLILHIVHNIHGIWGIQHVLMQLLSVRVFFVKMTTIALSAFWTGSKSIWVIRRKRIQMQLRKLILFK